MKFLRGTALDVFGYTGERRTERKLIDDYLVMIDQHIAVVKSEQIPILVRLARFPETIRGYGHIKEQGISKSLAEKARLEADLESSRFAVAAE